MTTSPLVGASIEGIFLGFMMIFEHKSVVRSILSSSMRPGNPQYSPGPWPIGICGVNHAVIATVSGKTTANSEVSFSSSFVTSSPSFLVSFGVSELRLRRIKLNSSGLTCFIAVALMARYWPMTLDSLVTTQSSGDNWSLIKNSFPKNSWASINWSWPMFLYWIPGSMLAIIIPNPRPWLVASKVTSSL